MRIQELYEQFKVLVFGAKLVLRLAVIRLTGALLKIN